MILSIQVPEKDRWTNIHTDGGRNDRWQYPSASMATEGKNDQKIYLMKEYTYNVDQETDP